MDKLLTEMSSKELIKVLNSLSEEQIEVIKGIFAAVAAGAVLCATNSKPDLTPIGVAVEVSNTIHSIKLR